MKRKNRKPSFLWQGVLILAPVLVLAKIGALAISQDRRIARHEAEVRAQDIADEAAQAIWTSLQDSNQPAGQAIPLILPELPDTNGSRRISTNVLTGTIKPLYVQHPVLLLSVNAAGQLVWPPPYEVTPSPEPFNPAALDDSQRALRETARSESMTNAPLSQRAQTWKQFIDSDPPTNFMAAALFALGETRLEMGMNAEAEDCFRAIVERYSSATTESGLPVRPLAVFKEFQARNAHGIEPRSYADQYAKTLAQLLAEPLAITPELLTQLIAMTNHPALPADVAREKQFQSAKAWYEWETHEQVRRIHSAASPFPVPPPAAFWVRLKKEAPMHFPPRYIESPPRPHSTMREPEPSPNAPTAVWSNAMAEEASERSRRIMYNYYHHGVGRLIVDERWLLVHLTNGSPTTSVAAME